MEVTERGFAPANLAQVYFTSPGLEPGDEEDTPLDDALIALIDGADDTLDLCLYTLNYAPIVEAIVHAFDRGVAVRFVGDADEADDTGIIALESAGVPMQFRETSGIMHNKFAVVDQRVVWTGSTNLTDTGLLRNNNDALLLDSTELAQAYTAEFEQMYVDGLFAGKKNDVHGTHTVPFNEREVEFYFSPEHDVIDVLSDLITEADESAYFMVFSFTHDDIADALVDADLRGVEVAGIFDSSQASSRYSRDEVLAEEGLSIHHDGNHNSSGFSGGKLHHKALIVDAGTDSDPFVVTGSFNWSKNADTRNDENLIVLREPGLVDAYLERFCALLADASPHASATTSGATACPESSSDRRPSDRLRDWRR